MDLRQDHYSKFRTVHHRVFLCIISGTGQETRPKHNYCHKRDINLPSSGICVVYHDLFTCTRALHDIYLHRAGPRAVRQRCVGGHGHASKWYNEERSWAPRCSTAIPSRYYSGLRTFRQRCALLLVFFLWSVRRG